jgi:hypothetical protein
MELWRDRPVPTTPWKLYDLDGPNVEKKAFNYAMAMALLLGTYRALGRLPFKSAIPKMLGVTFVFNLVYYQDKTILF